MEILLVYSFPKKSKICKVFIPSKIDFLFLIIQEKIHSVYIAFLWNHSVFCRLNFVMTHQVTIIFIH